MRKLLFLLPLIFITSCKDDEQKIKNNRILESAKILNELEASAAKSATITDSFFVGYRFGMTKTEYENHTEKLHKENILKTDDKGYYAFEFPSKIQSKPLKANLSSDFFDGKLYKFSLVIEDEYPLIALNSLTDIYKKKYGEYAHIGSLIDGFYEYYWFNNNIEIKIYNQITGAVVTYSDMKSKMIKEKEDSLNQEKKEKEIIKGI